MDANQEAAKRLSVLSLPTTIVFGADGRPRFRITGVPKAADLRVGARAAIGLRAMSLGKLSDVSARLELVLTKRRAVDLCRVAGCCCCCRSC